MIISMRQWHYADDLLASAHSGMFKYMDMKLCIADWKTADLIQFKTFQPREQSFFKIKANYMELESIVLNCGLRSIAGNIVLSDCLFIDRARDFVVCL